MNHRHIFLIFTFLAFSPWSQAGGVIGSGAGVVEMNFQYVYSTLPTWIKNCQKTPKPENILETVCDTNGAFGELYRRILDVQLKNRGREDRIVFVSGQEHPGFFDTNPNELHRIAKTFLNAEASIYVNLDQLYFNDGNPAIDLSTTAAILLHELGHQTSEPNHDVLNRLSAQMRMYLNASSLIYEFELGAKPDLMRMTFVNQKNPYVSTVIFSWLGLYSINLTSKVLPFVSCSEPEKKALGFNLSNGQFVPSGDSVLAIGFNFWMDIICPKYKSSKTEKQKKVLQFMLTTDRKIELKEVK